MKKLILLASLLFLVTSIGAQAKLDSLHQIWTDTTQADTVRLNAMNELIFNFQSRPDSMLVLTEMMLVLAKEKGLKRYQADATYTNGMPYVMMGDIDKSIEIFTESLKLSEEIGYSWGVVRGHLGLGFIFNQQGHYKESLEYLNKALGMAEELATKSKNGKRVLGETEYFTMNSFLGGINQNLGEVYSNMTNYVKAIESTEQALKYLEAEGDKGGMAGTLNNIGNIYMHLEDFLMARDYYERSLKIAEEIDNKYVMAADIGNLGSISMQVKDYEIALEYFNRALTLNKETGDQYRIGQTLGNISGLYLNLKNYPKAIEYLDQAATIFRSIGALGNSADLLVQRGIIFLEQDNYTQAIRWCKKGLDQAEEIKGLITSKLNACGCLYEAHKSLNQWKPGLEYHEQYMILNDSIQSGETGKKLQQMEFDKQILADSLIQEEEKLKVDMAHAEEVSRKDKTRNVLMGSGLLVLLFAGGLWNRLNFTRKSKATLQIEKDRSESLLLNILPAEVAEELKLNGEALAKDFDMVSIIFTDFKGFTEASAKLNASELLDELNYCFKGFDMIMEKYGIEKIKTIGDAYMAAGGMSDTSDDSAKNTVKAALEMQELIATRKKEQDAKGLMGFEMRAGIHTGPVVAGIVGVKKFQYDIWGDTVNTASRMESSGEVGQVNISQDTYELVKDDGTFTFENRGKIQAKGKGEMEMYFVS